MSSLIEHSGIITRLEEDKIYVRIYQQSACNTCHAKNTCMASGRQEKEIVVKNTDSSLQIGDSVTLYGESSNGLFAVLIAFVIPFVLILLCLFLLKNTVQNESAAAFIALGILVPYYLILALFNNKLNKKMQFRLKKN